VFAAAARADTASMDENLWPCRGVAEYAYCPRVFYYMIVEGVFVPSHDTEEGKAVHARADRPSRRSRPPQDEDPDRPEKVRSLVLTSARLGLTATLDLAEITGQTAVPVEYRKGRPRHAAPSRDAGDDLMDAPPSRAAAEPWPTDRVQVGLQALLLEEAGYTVSEAVIYYAAEKLRLRVAVDDALRREALETLDAAKTAANGPRPLPLVNDPRCAGCSLQPVCLPDEVNQLRQAAADPVSPQRLWPPRADGIQVVAQRHGVHIGIRGHSLRFVDREGDVVREMPIVNVEALAVLGGVQVSTQALSLLADRGIPVAFLTAAGRLTAIMDPLGPVSAVVRCAQVTRLDDPGAALALARALVLAKIANQRTLLMRNHPAPAGVARELSRSVVAAERARTMDELRGHEGNAARAYFENFAGVFKGEAESIGREFDAIGRQRRPPPDPINSVLSFAYTMLTHDCVAALRLASLEPTIGALHTTRPGRPAMALDLMEPFRPLIADSLAVSAFNRGELGEGHFIRTTSGCALTDAGRQAFFAAYARRMNTEITHPVFGYRLSYRRMLTLHARMIAAWLVGEVPALTFLTTR
jgi:CRISPR-associated protein Cas1